MLRKRNDAAAQSQSSDFNVPLFIDVVYKYQFLWDKQHPSYLNYRRKQVVWEGTADDFHLPVEEIKKNLRGHFVVRHSRHAGHDLSKRFATSAPHPRRKGLRISWILNNKKHLFTSKLPLVCLHCE